MDKIVSKVKITDYRETFAWFAYASAILFFGGLSVLLAIWWLWPYKTVDLVTIGVDGNNVGVLELAKYELEQGETIPFYIEGYRYTDARVEVEKFLLCDSGRYSVYDPGATLPAGHIIRRVAQNTVVPYYLEDGDKCRLLIRNEYWTNPLFPRTLWWITEEFSII